MIEAGDIILVKGRTPIISRLIRWFTKSEYTHVGIAVTKRLICEIDFNKDLAIRVNKHKEFNVYRFKDGLTHQQKKRMKEYIFHSMKDNKGYDFLRIFGFVIERLLRIPFSPQKAQRVICSEVVDEAYYHAGIDLVPERDNGHVAPVHLAQSSLLMKVM